MEKVCTLYFLSLSCFIACFALLCFMTSYFITCQLSITPPALPLRPLYYTIHSTPPAPTLTNSLTHTQGTPGLSAPPILNKLSLRASLTGSIFLDNVRVGKDALLEKAIGLGAAFSCLNNARWVVLFTYLIITRVVDFPLLVPHSLSSSSHTDSHWIRYGISWGVMGALEDCLARARAYALERHQFKRPLASFQLVQKKLVDAQSEVGLGLLAALQVGCSSFLY